jgi:hypothetical protein
METLVCKPFASTKVFQICCRVTDINVGNKEQETQKRVVARSPRSSEGTIPPQAFVLFVLICSPWFTIGTARNRGDLSGKFWWSPIPVP